MFLPRLSAALVSLAVLVGCAKNDLTEAPVPLGDFVMGLNIVVTDNMQKVPISREASGEEWQAAMKKAISDRFGRYEGSKIYNIGISVDGYALAPPGIPLVAAPKSVLVITANIWDDAAGKKLNAEGKQITVFEGLSGETVIGTGITRSKAQQMEALAFNAAKQVETWFLENPEWFGLTAEDVVNAKKAAAKAKTTPPAVAAPTAKVKTGTATQEDENRALLP